MQPVNFKHEKWADGHLASWICLFCCLFTLSLLLFTFSRMRGAIVSLPFLFFILFIFFTPRSSPRCLSTINSKLKKKQPKNEPREPWSIWTCCVTPFGALSGGPALGRHLRRLYRRRGAAPGQRRWRAVRPSVRPPALPDRPPARLLVNGRKWRDGRREGGGWREP